MEKHFVRSHMLSFDLQHLASCRRVCPVFIDTYAAMYLMTQLLSVPFIAITVIFSL